MKIEETIEALFQQPEMREVIRKIAGVLRNPKLDWYRVSSPYDPVVVAVSQVPSEVSFEELLRVVRRVSEGKFGIIKSFEGDGSKVVAHLGTGVGLTATCFGAYSMVKLEVELYPDAYELVAKEKELQLILEKLREVRDSLLGLKGRPLRLDSDY